MKMAQAVFLLLFFFFASPTSTTLLHKTTASTTVLNHPHPKSTFSTSVLDHSHPKSPTSTAALDHKTATSIASLDQIHTKTGTGFQVPLRRRVDFVGTKSELLLQSINLAKQRMQTMDSPIVVETPITAGNGNFVAELWIGTPPKSISAVIDTTRDLIWTPCRQPCEQPPCSSTPTIFDPSNSTTYSKLSCSSELCSAFPIPICLDSDCLYVDTFSQGTMATDTVTFGGNVSITKIGFGCAEGNHQGVGIVGLGRGPLSLVSQIGAIFFSYCIPPYESSESGSLLFTAAPPQHLLLSRNSSLIVTTPLITNPSHPSLYYLTVEGISIGHQLLPIKKSSFQVKPDGSGGVIIDSGSPVTFLEDKAFRLVKKEFTEQIKLPTVDESSIGLEACYALPPSRDVDVPQFVLHFGGGADLILPTNNFFVTFTTPDLIIGCLAMLPSHVDGMSIIGNFQTQNMVVLHDLLGQRLSFLPTTSCRMS